MGVNNMLNRILNSSKLFTLTIVLSIVLCVCLSSLVESRPNNLKYNSSSYVKNATQQIDQNSTDALYPVTSRSPVVNITDLNHIDVKQENSTFANNSLVNTKSNKNSNQTSLVKNHELNLNPRGQKLNLIDHELYDYVFFFRLFIFISAFCFVIFLSIYIKSFNKRGVYGYLDTRCGDEEKLMKHDGDYWDNDDDEVTIFDAIDFKKQHYKDYGQIYHYL